MITDKIMHLYADMRADRQTNRQTDRQTDIQRILRTATGTKQIAYRATTDVWFAAKNDNWSLGKGGTAQMSVVVFSRTALRGVSRKLTIC